MKLQPSIKQLKSRLIDNVEKYTKLTDLEKENLYTEPPLQWKSLNLLSTYTKI